MKEHSQIITVDCDDVLVPCSEKLVQAYNGMYGTQVQLADIYGNSSAVWGAGNSDEAQRRVEACMRINAEEFLLPYPEAVAAINGLARRHELHLITGRRDFLEPITRRTLEEFFPGCFQTIEHTNHFAPTDEAHLRRSKGEVCRRLGAHVLIDDHLDHIKSATDCGVKAILFGDYPWNQSDSLPSGVVRCRDWVEVEEKIEELAMLGVGEAGRG